MNLNKSQWLNIAALYTFNLMGEENFYFPRGKKNDKIPEIYLI